MVISAMIFIMIASLGFSNNYARLIGIAGLILILGALRFQSSISENNLSQFYDENAEVEGIVVREPDLRDDRTLLTLGQLKISDENIDDNILVTVYPHRNFSYGDKIKVIGKIQEPKVFPDFNYKNYLSRFHVHAVMYYPKNDFLAADQGNVIKSNLFMIKNTFIRNLSDVLPEPQNAFLAGLLVGNKRSIPQSFIDKFSITGTSHIIAISGYNITIIIWVLEKMLQRYGKRVSMLISILTILSFVILTGGSASVIRAAIMGGLILLARNIGRLDNMTNSMVFTAGVMILLNPQILLYDVGFQLSFLALSGLVYLSPILNLVFKVLPKIIREPLVATCSAQIFALPILLYNFDQLSLIAPLTNVLVLETVPPTMLFGFLTGILGFVSEPLSALLAWPAWICLSYILMIVDLTSKIPYASASVHLNLPGVISYYVALIALLYWYKLYKGEKLNEQNVFEPALYPHTKWY
jgi:competence protein ComEC